MSIEVKQIPCLGDNYGFLVHDTETGATASIDTPEVEPINNALAEQGWTLTHILNTHHHFDHAGGNEELKAQWGCEIIGAACDAERIPGIDRRVVDGEVFQLGNAQVKVLKYPATPLATLPIILPMIVPPLWAIRCLPWAVAGCLKGPPSRCGAVWKS